MNQYSGFQLKFSQENISDNAKIPTACLSVFVENKGDAVLTVKTSSGALFTLNQFDSLTLPANGNNNPLLVILEDLSFEFGAGTTKATAITKTFAVPSIINY